MICSAVNAHELKEIQWEQFQDDRSLKVSLDLQQAYCVYQSAQISRRGWLVAEKGLEGKGRDHVSLWAALLLSTLFSLCLVPSISPSALNSGTGGSSCWSGFWKHSP